jgi:hypothetical protein
MKCYELTDLNFFEWFRKLRKKRKINDEGGVIITENSIRQAGINSINKLDIGDNLLSSVE